jgi:hypothetical protein
MIELLVFIGIFGAGALVGIYGTWFATSEIKQLSPPKVEEEAVDPMEERIYPYLFLLKTDPYGWTIQDNSFFGWTRLTHGTGKYVSIYKKDGDVVTDVFGQGKLTNKEKRRIRTAVYKMESLKTLDKAAGLE